ncbi:hypothetical protein FS749_016281 [Ceratobasidium sp. UAMH 11750]|nr:hypothetical protein FS749_016281 [Ceratobasidium sp. UAMH 11750]
MSPYYTGPVPTAPRFWDMKATSSLDSNLDRVRYLAPRVVKKFSPTSRPSKCQAILIYVL